VFSDAKKILWIIASFDVKFSGNTWMALFETSRTKLVVFSDAKSCGNIWNTYRYCAVWMQNFLEKHERPSSKHPEGVFSSAKRCKKSTVARFGFIW
jgi:hypothetical protein